MKPTAKLGLAALATGVLVTAAALATSASSANASKTYHPRTGKPFSSAVKIGDYVYVSGVAGASVDGTIPKDFATQATNSMNGVAAYLKLAGATMDDVYRCTVALTNMDNWAEFNSVYVKYFKEGRYPVRMSYGVTNLGGSDVEVQCEAHLGK